ncbi:MAG TPA: SRPBCC family protein [Salegentibacter sp.]|nr:SRPBCC family protein [Salegentibacter sp.]
MEPENEKKTNVGNSKGSERGSDFDKRNVSNSGRTETGNQAYDKNLSNKKRSESSSEAKKWTSKNRDHDKQGDWLSTIRENKKGILGVLGAVVGGALLYKGAKGMGSSNKSSSRSVTATSKATINQPREKLYAYWRNLENLPNFMSHIKEVREIGNNRSEWTAKIPGGLGTIEWDAEIIQERTNHLLMWRSLPGSEIDNSGEVRFEIDPKGRGTIVETTITYKPPAGAAGGFAAKLVNPAFEKLVKKDLKEFKKLMESGRAEKRRSKHSSKV